MCAAKSNRSSATCLTSVNGESGPSRQDTIHYLSPVSGRSIQEEQLPAFPQTLQEEEYFSVEDVCESSAGTSIFEETRNIERTLAIIKPKAVQFADVVITKLLKEGFLILAKRKIHLSPEQASDLLGRYYGKPSFPYQVVTLSAAPVIVLCISAPGAVLKWKELAKNGTLDGKWFRPRHILYQYGIKASIEDALHASENLDIAKKEVRFFFPQDVIEPILKGEPTITDYLSKYVNPTLSEALTDVCKRKPAEPIIYLSEWLILHNPNKPRMKPDIALLPT